MADAGVVEKGTARAQRPIKVLIIDDEPDIVETLAHLFRNAGGFAVEKAFDGQAGWEKVRTFRPDVVLLDLVMPNTDGWEFCRKLRGDPETRHLPVVMMTACAGPEIESYAHAEGIHRVLFKPFALRGLVETLLGALPLRRAKAGPLPA